MKSKVDTAATIVVALVAVLMLGMYATDRARGSGNERGPIEASNWAEFPDHAIEIGAADAPVVIAAFMDFTCPYCRNVAPVIDSLMARFPGQIALQFMHFPIEGHEFAVPSAVAAECADRQDSFYPMYQALFAQFDRLGTAPWDSIAAQAKVPDLEAFSSCMDDGSDQFPRIRSAQALGTALGVTGTPTILINGKEYNERSVDALMEVVSEFGVK